MLQNQVSFRSIEFQYLSKIADQISLLECLVDSLEVHCQEPTGEQGSDYMASCSACCRLRPNLAEEKLVDGSEQQNFEADKRAVVHSVENLNMALAYIAATDSIGTLVHLQMDQT